MGGGQTPITYLAYRAYAHDQGIADSDFDLFRETMYKLDGVYLQIEGEKVKARRNEQTGAGEQ